MPRISQQDFFSSELAKVLIAKKNLSKLSAFFFFLFGAFRRPPHLRARAIERLQTNFGYSVVKYRQKQKRAATRDSLFEKLRVAAPFGNFEFQFYKTLKFLRFGSGNEAAPAFLKLFLHAI